MPILGIVASSTRQGLVTDTGAMFPLGMVSVGSAGAANITFSSIPSTYKHLQLRYMDLSTSSAGDMRLQFNTDTASNYSRHVLYGTGAVASAGGTANSDYVLVGQSGDSTYASVGVIDILQYADTNIYKTVRTLNGYDVNGAGGYAVLASGSWRSTAAITSIKIFISGNSFNQYSQFALYGIKGA